MLWGTWIDLYVHLLQNEQTTTYEHMCQNFCKQFWTTITTYKIMTKLSTIKQHSYEKVDEYYAQFLKLCDALTAWLEDDAVIVWFRSGLQTWLMHSLKACYEAAIKIEEQRTSKGLGGNFLTRYHPHNITLPYLT